jgi:hypothetical protein
MAAGALAALVTGEAYDRLGPQVLLILPFLAAAVPALAFGGDLGTVVVGVLLWGGGRGPGLNGQSLAPRHRHGSSPACRVHARRSVVSRPSDRD